MSHTDLGQPDLAALRAAAGNAEVEEAEARLLDCYRYWLGGADPLAPLARAIARALTEAGLTLHHCATHDPLYRLGGVCCCRYTPRPERAGARSRCRGPPTTCFATSAGTRTYWDTHQAMNAALGSVLTAFGYQVAPFGSGGAWLVTGRRTRGTGAGQ